MMKPTFEPKISLGSIITLLGMLGSLALAYSDIRANEARLEAKISEVDRIGDLRARMNKDKFDQEIAVMRADSLQFSVRIESTLDRIERKIDAKADKK